MFGVFRISLLLFIRFTQHDDRPTDWLTRSMNHFFIRPSGAWTNLSPTTPYMTQQPTPTNKAKGRSGSTPGAMYTLETGEVQLPKKNLRCLTRYFKEQSTSTISEWSADDPPETLRCPSSPCYWDNTPTQRRLQWNFLMEKIFPPESTCRYQWWARLRRMGKNQNSNLCTQ